MINFASKLPLLSGWPEIASLGAALLVAFILSFVEWQRRLTVLSVISVVVIAILSPWGLLLLATEAGLMYHFATAEKRSPRLLRRLSWAFVALLLLYKVAIYFEESFDTGHIITVLGVSYFTFKIAALGFDTARAPLPNIDLRTYLAWIFFFPTYLAGPIQRFGEFRSSELDPIERLEVGLIRICQGIFVKLIVADIFLFELIKSNIKHALDDHSVGAALSIGPLGLARVFADFSSLSHMVIGLGLLLGFYVPENFNRPYLATNLGEFWRRWHMSLSRWATDYIFTPLLLGTRNRVLAFVMTFVFIGVWHEPSPNWLIWGLGHALGLLTYDRYRMSKLSRFAEAHIPERLLQFLAWLITVGYVSWIFTLVSGLSFGQAMKVYGIILSALIG